MSELLLGWQGQQMGGTRELDDFLSDRSPIFGQSPARIA
jgi:hypothetical protein